MKTIQEIMDEQRALSKVHEISERSAAASIRMEDQDARDHLSKLNTGKKLDDDVKAKIARARTGSIKSEDTKLKMKLSRARRGPMSEESKLKNSISHLGKISKIKNTSIYIFNSDKGEFNNIRDLQLAYPERSLGTLKVWCIKNRHGFSQRLKDENDSGNNG